MTENNDIHIEESKCAFASATGQAVSKGQTVRSVDGAQVTNNPKLRFKGFEGEWKKLKLGDIFSERTESDKEGEMLSVTMHEGIIKASDNGRFDNSSSDKSNYKLVLEKDIAYNSMRMWQGASGCSPYRGIVSPAYTVITPDEGVDSMFFAYYFKTKPMIEKFRLHSQGLTKDTWNLKFPTFSKIFVAYPQNIKMQQKIASYFSALDHRIALQSQHLERLKQVKEASLQAMFPQEGETVPKIRFKGFDGDWKKEKLNSFAKRIMRKNSNLESTLALTIASAYGLVSQIDYFNNSVVGANLKNYYLLKKGEFAYNKSYSNGYPFGSVKRLDRYEQGILSTLYIVFDIDDSISSDYLTHFFDTTLWHKEVAERAAEGARNHGLLNIGAEDFLDINIWKPQTKEEQQKIASYFSTLDRKIELQSQRLEKLKQIKAACLDKMFV